MSVRFVVQGLFDRMPGFDSVPRLAALQQSARASREALHSAAASHSAVRAIVGSLRVLYPNLTCSWFALFAVCVMSGFTRSWLLLRACGRAGMHVRCASHGHFGARCGDPSVRGCCAVQPHLTCTRSREEDHLKWHSAMRTAERVEARNDTTDERTGSHAQSRV